MKKNILLLAISATLLSLTLEASQSSAPATNKMLVSAQKSVPSISPKEFYDLIEQDAYFIQVDIRESDENSHGEIWSFNKVQLTRGYIEYKLEKAIQNKDAKLVVVCCSGKRAALAAKTIQDLGYTNVRYLDGGIGGWLHAGYPLDTVYGELWLKK